MYKKFILTLLVPFVFVLCDEPVSSDLIEQKKVIGEFLGHLLWQSCSSGSRYDEVLDPEDIANGMKEAASKMPPKIDYETFIAFSAQLERDNFEKIASKNLDEAEAFLAKLSLESDVQELVRGKLYVKILSEGYGEEFKASQSGRFNLTASFLNQPPFCENRSVEGTLQSNKPAIKGFGEGTTGMKQGEKRIIYIHPDLGYGKLTFYEPNCLIIVEAELVKIEEGELD